MKIEDRPVNSSWLPAVQVLEEVIRLFKPEYFAGIRKVVLLDEDYPGSKSVRKAAGRYCAIHGTRAADIELYLGYMATLPEELKANRMLFTYLITELFMHEISHHLIRGQRRLRKPSSDEEQRIAALVVAETYHLRSRESLRMPAPICIIFADCYASVVVKFFKRTLQRH